MGFEDINAGVDVVGSYLMRLGLFLKGPDKTLVIKFDHTIRRGILNVSNGDSNIRLFLLMKFPHFPVINITDDIRVENKEWAVKKGLGVFDGAPGAKWAFFRDKTELDPGVNGAEIIGEIIRPVARA